LATSRSSIAGEQRALHSKSNLVKIPGNSLLKSFKFKFRFTFKSKYFSKRMLIIFMLGFSSGLPVALIGSLLQAWFRTSGVDLVTIGFLSLLGQPYTYKFLWAPLLDYVYLPFAPRCLKAIKFKLIDLKRQWMITSQLLIIFIMVVMSFGEPKTSPIFLGFLGFLLAIMSATQDVAIDGYRVAVLAIDERGLGSALAVEGYRIALIIAGWLGFIIADHCGWQATYLFMAFLMLIGLIAAFCCEPCPSSSEIPKLSNLVARKANVVGLLWKLMLDPLKSFFHKEKALGLLVLIIFYKLGDALSHSLASVFLIDLGFSLTAIGTINKFVGVMATLIGIMFAGIIMTRVSLVKTMLFFGILQGLANLLYVVLASYGKNYYLAIGIFFIENLCSGMGTSALLALITSLCEVKYSAAHFAFLSSCSSIGRVYIGALAGRLVELYGWKIFYICSTLFAIPGILLTLYLKKQIMLYDNTQKVCKQLN
jgi:MFS transporter, PAT family, beta-lactamase induction signal transducer AmpG